MARDAQADDQDDLQAVAATVSRHLEVDRP
jgi:hypothetical protein